MINLKALNSLAVETYMVYLINLRSMDRAPFHRIFHWGKDFPRCFCRSTDMIPNVPNTLGCLWVQFWPFIISPKLWAIFCPRKNAAAAAFLFLNEVLGQLSYHCPSSCVCGLAWVLTWWWGDRGRGRGKMSCSCECSCRNTSLLNDLHQIFTS